MAKANIGTTGDNYDRYFVCTAKCTAVTIVPNERALPKSHMCLWSTAL